MKAIAINGSPRKGWNTATLLRKALAGEEKRRGDRASAPLRLGVRGCIHCFSCQGFDEEPAGARSETNSPRSWTGPPRPTS